MIGKSKEVRKYDRKGTYCNSQVITTSQLSNLTNRSERSTHNNSLVPKLLVVVEDLANGHDSWVLGLGIGLSGLGFVPIQDTADEGGDEEDAGLGGSDGLYFGEEEGEVAVDAVLLLEDARGLDSFPGRCDLDQDAGLVDADGLVKLFSC